MKKLILLTIIISGLLMQGCSAVMALNGEKEPSFELIKPGQNKAIVESQPVTTQLVTNKV